MLIILNCNKLINDQATRLLFAVQLIIFDFGAFYRLRYQYEGIYLACAEAARPG